MRLKYQVPLIKNSLLNRLELYNGIVNATNSYKIVLITAPAGYSKTTSIVESIKLMGYNNIWISFDKFDNNLSVFLFNLIDSIPDINKNIFPQNELNIYNNNFEKILLQLIEEISKLNLNFLMVLDDIHVINSESVCNAFNFFINNLPENLRIIISSRNKTENISFSEIKRKNEFYEISIDKLKFNESEIKSFFSNIHNINNNEIQIINERTEGWAFSLQMLHILFNKSKDINEIIKSFSGNNVHIREFLTNEILNNIDKKTETFLLITSILNKFNYELVSYVSGIKHCEDIIETLNNQNLFITSLDSNKEWFRYHGLFQEILYTRLLQKYPNKIKDYYIKTYTWFKEKGFLDESINYAEIIGDYEYILSLIEDNCIKIYSEGNMFKLLNWCEKVPIDILIKNQLAYLYYLICLLDLNNIYESEKLIKNFENLYDINQLSIKIINIYYQVKTFFCSKNGDKVRFKFFLDKLFEYVPKNDYFLLGSANNLLANYYSDTHDLEKSIKYYNISSENFYKAEAYHPYIDILVYTSNALLKIDIKSAEKSFNKILNLIDNNHNFKFYKNERAVIYSCLSMIYYHTNNLDECNKFIQKTINSCSKLKNSSDIRFCLNRVIDIKQNLGNFDESDLYIQELIKLNNKSIITKETISNFNIRKDIYNKNYQQCVLFLYERSYIKESYDFIKLSHIQIFRLIECLIFTNKLDEAEEFINKVIKYHDFAIVVIKIYLFKALVYYKQNKINESKECIEKALFIGQKQGLIRLFTDFFEELHPLILNTLNNTPALSLDYIKSIKNSFNIKEKIVLSSREIEILKMVCNGLSNKEISNKLNITIHTVKVHLKNIFNKTNIKRRTQANNVLKDLNFI